MSFLRGGLPHCKRCGVEFQDIPEICPQCGFYPRDQGLKIAIWLLILVVVLIMAAIVATFVFALISIYLVLGATLAFAGSVAAFVVAFIVNPYRLGGLFA